MEEGHQHHHHDHDDHVGGEEGMEDAGHHDCIFHTSMSYFQKAVHVIVVERDPTLIGILVAVTAVLLTSLIIKIIVGRRQRGNVFLLAGLCDSGKTYLHTLLVDNKSAVTVTSMKENVGDYMTKGKKRKLLTLVALPGHERIRQQVLDKYKTEARALLFVVDSSTVSDNVQDLAEYLYTLLTDTVINKNVKHMLIACNKQDLTMVKSAKVIQSQIEKEINTVRVTRSGALASTTGEPSSRDVYLGKHGRDFDFSHLGSPKVVFVEVNCKGRDNEQADFEELENWLERVA